ncbi:MAG TPA: DSD1 family PLP-dependent enzyme [Terriglobia bacterium]|nr:DSD1 family PLP-dependent enzyme [Terriglobia bacterium]
MQSRLPSPIPLFKDDIPTPALLVNLDLFERNLQKMADCLNQRRISFRPHAKTHRCPTIAKKQIALGAVGICVAKLSEAEIMAASGIANILITSEIVGKPKIERLLSLSDRSPSLMAVVDHPAVVQDLVEATEARKTALNLLIDIDGGTHRTGCVPGRAALTLAQEICRSRWLRLRGIQCYAGRAAHTVGFEERRRYSEERLAEGLETKAMIEKHGMPVDIFTGGSTGTYDIDVAIEGFTELQAGSYIFMDLDYRRIGSQRGESFQDFEYALAVLTTVISQSHVGLATVDAGFKAFSTDKPFVPELKHDPGVKFRWAGDEHGILDLEGAQQAIKLGDRLEFIPPHCDPTVNLYDYIYAIRGGQVEEIWPVEARGMSQ